MLFVCCVPALVLMCLLIVRCIEDSSSMARSLAKGFLSRVAAKKEAAMMNFLNEESKLIESAAEVSI